MKCFINIIPWLSFCVATEPSEKKTGPIKIGDAKEIEQTNMISDLISSFEKMKVTESKIEKKQSEVKMPILKKYNDKLYKHLDKLQSFDQQIIEEIKKEKKTRDEELAELSELEGQKPD